MGSAAAMAILIAVRLLFYGVFAALAVLGICALAKYLRGRDRRAETAAVRRTLGEALRACRMERGMTQEFVAEALGVSRQAVSKWETGAAEPSTSNLLALARLYGVSAEELLKKCRVMGCYHRYKSGGGHVGAHAWFLI